MKLDIVAVGLPPRFDAIGHYSAQFAETIARQPDTRIRILTLRDDATTADGKAGSGVCTPIPGVEIVPCFGVNPPNGVSGLNAAIDADPPDWLFLQYNPFQYGHQGRNLSLPFVIRSARRRHPRMRVATMFHEMFVPIIDLRFAVMATWQRPQAWLLGGASDVVFISIEKWARQYAGWFPGKPPVVHLPIGSNIDRITIDRAEARRRLGIAPETHLLGLFGSLHVSRMLPLVRDTLQAARQSMDNVRLLHVGPDGPAAREALKSADCDDDTIIFTESALPPDEVSRRIAAMDVMLCPFVDGVSTRRSSFMTGIQHGIASVGTYGFNTDQVLRDAGDRGPLLVDVQDTARFKETVILLLRDEARRQSVAENGERLYQAHFTFEQAAKRAYETLAAVTSGKHAGF